MSNDVFIDEDSILSRYAELHGRMNRRPVAAIGPESLRASLFAEDEVVIDGEDRALIRELRDRHGAEVIEEPPLPPPPAHLERRREFDAGSMPTSVRLRFATPPRLDDRESLLEHFVPRDSKRAQKMVVTSEMAASVAALTVRHALDGRPVGLNYFGEPLSMPLSTATEGTFGGVGADPFSWQTFAGRTRMVEAWQLVDSVKRIRGDRLIIVALLDRGFWLDGRGVPIVSPTQWESDLGSRFIQLNLQDESKPAGGMAPSGFAWHGNCTASVATATVNNSVGAAGSGGTIAAPFMFQSDFSVTQILRCVKICAAWGIDVLNMSFGIWGTAEISFPTTLWNKTFQFGFDNDVAMVAAAGNFGEELPGGDDHIRPATRTPGVLTVGALDQSDNARGDSDYGSSVWLWAPGTNIPVAPFPGQLNGGFFSQTSAAAPVVAGVAAMMRYVNDGLSAADIRRILVDTGWAGRDRVSKGLDAYAAVLTALNGVLPDTDEPNNTLATARDLFPIGPGGALTPWTGGFSTRSQNIDPDYWKFRLDRHSLVTVAVDWYDRLGSLFCAVLPDDTSATGPDDMTRTASAGRLVMSGILPPGGYRVRIGGTGVTAYRLVVNRKVVALERDIFENNDSFERAARLLFEPRRGVKRSLSTFGPGTYDATLHQDTNLMIDITGHATKSMNDDYYRFDVPAGPRIAFPTVSVFDSDAPLTVTMFDVNHAFLQSWKNVREMSVRPPVGTTCFLKVFGAVPTRYKIRTRMAADPHIVPDLQEELDYLPRWWGDPPPVTIGDIVSHYVVEVSHDRGADTAIAFERPDEDLNLEILTRDGEIVGKAEEVNGRLFVDTQGLDAGAYVLRITRPDGTEGSKISLKTAPPLR